MIYDIFLSMTCLTLIDLKAKFPESMARDTPEFTNLEPFVYKQIL
jgi:hypothetical protein